MKKLFVDENNTGDTARHDECHAEESHTITSFQIEQGAERPLNCPSLPFPSGLRSSVDDGVDVTEVVGSEARLTTVPSRDVVVIRDDVERQ